MPMSPTYKVAYDKAMKASAAFREAQKAYRSRLIGDKEFLEAKRLNDQATAEFDLAYAKEEARGDSSVSTLRGISDSVAKLNTRIDAYCTRQDEDDGLTVVRKGTPERGVKIPPPKDPKERAAWEAGVKKREAEGRGRFVGDADSWPTSFRWNGSMWEATGKKGTNRSSKEESREYEKVDKDGKMTGERAWRTSSGKISPE